MTDVSPVYIVTWSLWAVFQIPTAVAKNVATVLVTRFISGAMGSTGSTMVGGTIADSMSTFSFSNILCDSITSLQSGSHQNDRVPWPSSLPLRLYGFGRRTGPNGLRSSKFRLALDSVHPNYCIVRRSGDCSTNTKRNEGKCNFK